MISFKKYIIIILLSFIVLGLAYIPIALSKIEENMIFDKFNISEFKKIEKKNDTTVSVIDKLDLISKYNTKNKNLVLIDKSKTLAKENELIVKGTQELKELQSIGIFPSINLDGNIRATNIDLLTIIDKNNSKKNVDICSIDFFVSGYNIYLCFDYKTNKIYSFSVYSKNNFLQNYNLQNLDLFFDYLEIKGEYYIQNDYNEYTINETDIQYRYLMNKNTLDIYLIRNDIQ